MISMERTCIYPGSFDPVTLGHLDIIRRACTLFDRVVVAVLHHPTKQGCFPVEQRLEMLRNACAAYPQVEVRAFTGMLVEAVEAVQATAVIRGLRSTADYETEKPMAQFNDELRPGTETVFLMAKPEHEHISSSAVRELAGYGVPLDRYVPKSSEKIIWERFHQS